MMLGREAMTVIVVLVCTIAFTIKIKELILFYNLFFDEKWFYIDFISFKSYIYYNCSSRKKREFFCFSVIYPKI